MIEKYESIEKTILKEERELAYIRNIEKKIDVNSFNRLKGIYKNYLIMFFIYLVLAFLILNFLPASLIFGFFMLFSVIVFSESTCSGIITKANEDDKNIISNMVFLSVIHIGIIFVVFFIFYEYARNISNKKKIKTNNEKEITNLELNIKKLKKEKEHIFNEILKDNKSLKKISNNKSSNSLKTKIERELSKKYMDIDIIKFHIENKTNKEMIND